ncbi:MAG: tetratricopeptide repeat protein [Planctomycetota bacterium]
MKSYSALPERERLLHPAAFALLSAILGAGVLLIFPGRRLAHTLADPEQQDSASVAYVDQALQAWPEDAELRIRVAERWVRAGELERARVAISPLIDTAGSDGARARFLSIAIEREALLAIPPSQRAAEAVASLMEKLEAMADVSRDVTHIEWLARTALLFGEPVRAARLFEHLASRDLARRVRWLRQAAQWFVAGGDSMRAAGIYATIAYETLSEEEFCSAALDSVAALRAANREGLGLERLLEFLEWHPNNVKLLDRAVALARSQDRPDLARDLGRRLAERRSVPRDVLERQIDAELALGDMPAALPLAARVVAEYPADANARARLAQFLTWSGRLPEAMPHWVEAARGDANPAYLTNALATARTLGDSTTIVELWRLQRTRAPMTAAGVIELAAAYEAIGEPAAAERELREYIANAPEQLEPSLMLARIQHGQGDLAGALATQRQILAHHQLTPERILAAARTLSTLGDDAAALDLLESHRGIAQRGDVEFWRALGRLAWEAENDKEALAAYRSLWRGSTRTEPDAERLIALLLAARHDEEALEVAEEAWREFDRMEFAVVALEAAVRSEQWGAAARLADEAKAQHPELLEDKRYWVVEATRYAAAADVPNAAEAYHRALAIDPHDAVVLAGALWYFIDANQLELLARLLERNEPGEVPQRELWGAYNAGLRRLGRPSETLERYDRFARAHAGDVLWGLEYAAALVEAQREDTSWRVRRELLPQAWQAGHALLARSHWTPEEARVVVGATRLVRELLGDEAARPWVEAVETRAADDDFLREFVVEQYLAQDDDDRAHAIVQPGERGEPPLERAVPRWERLSLALRTENLPEVAANLGARGESVSDLGRVDEIEGLRRLGRDDEAWSLSLSRLWERTGEVDTDNRSLLGLATRLGARHPQATRARLGVETLGNLEWTRSELATTFGTNTRQFELQVVEARVTTRSRTVAISGRSRQPQLVANLDLTTDTARHLLGVGVTDDGVNTLPSAHYDLRLGLGGAASGQVAVALNQLTQESDALRLAGAVDRVRARVAFELTPREYASAGVGWSEFYDRERASVARGLGLEFELGHRLHAGSRQFAVRAFGAAAFHQTPRSLPESFAEILGTTADPSAIVPREFAVFGVGLSTQHGQPAEWAPTTGGIRYHADVYAGWLLPAGQLTFAARASVGVEVLGRDELSLAVHYGDSQGGFENQDSSGVSVQYSYRFGR